jgi:acyl-lipid omega-6 desaturase (Delta-12 desaturase)
LFLPEAPRFSPPEPSKLALLRPYQAPVLASSVWQITSTFGLYIACLAAMYVSARVSLWLVLALAVPMSGLTVRIFMLQHDLGHHAMFRTRRFNDLAGMLCSLVTLTPYAYWRRLHARHHAAWNNLDVRGIPADFFADCVTVAEFAAMTPGQKRLYRLIHHPLLANLLLPPIVFLFLYRLPFDTPASCRRERNSVYLLDLALVAIFAGLTLVFGLKTVLLVHLPGMVLASIIGIWLFTVQHRFADAHWMRRAEWTQAEAALHGTSYLKLPPVLQWFSGNIGLHHVHHLNPGIPNYRLQACHDACLAVTGAATVLTLRQTFDAARYALWDEDAHCMVPFPS